MSDNYKHLGARATANGLRLVTSFDLEDESGFAELRVSACAGGKFELWASRSRRGTGRKSRFVTSIAPILLDTEQAKALIVALSKPAP